METRSWIYFWVFLTKRGIEKGSHSYFIFPQSLVFFFWRFLFFWGYTFGLYKSFSLFSLSMDLFSSCPGKIWTVADKTYPAWSVVLHSDHTLESPMSFQSPFAQAIPKANQSKFMRAPQVLPKVNATRAKDACPVGSPVWFTEPKVSH